MMMTLSHVQFLFPGNFSTNSDKTTEKRNKTEGNSVLPGGAIAVIVVFVVVFVVVVVVVIMRIRHRVRDQEQQQQQQQEQEPTGAQPTAPPPPSYNPGFRGHHGQ